MSHTCVPHPFDPYSGLCAIGGHPMRPIVLSAPEWAYWRKRADLVRDLLIDRGAWSGYDEGTWEEMTPNTNTVTTYGVLDRDECAKDANSAVDMKRAIIEWEGRL